MAVSPVPVQWRDGQAVMSFPEHIDVSNAGQVREQLLTIINRGPSSLIADMSATASCDHAGMDALARAYQRACVSGTQLRLVVTAPIVMRVLGVEGIDRLISIYPSVEAALAAGAHAPATSGASRVAPAGAGQLDRGRRGGAAGASASPVLLWQLIDALGDGLVLTRHDGEIVLTNHRCDEMFGYQRGELIGRPVESLVPDRLRAAHQQYRAAYASAPVARPMAERARLVGTRKDGGTIPVEITLSPVPTATDHFIMAVVRDATEAWRRRDLADLAKAAAAEQAHHSQELLDRVAGNLFQVGLSLQAAAELPAEVARERITESLARLDDTIHEIRDHAFA